MVSTRSFVRPTGVVSTTSFVRQDHITWFLSGALLGLQVKDHITWFLPRASLGPQVSCVSNKSFVEPTGKIVILTKMELS